MTTRETEPEKQPEEPTAPLAQTMTKTRTNKTLIITLACVGAALLIALSASAAIFTHYLRSNVGQTRSNSATRHVTGRRMGAPRKSTKQMANVTRGVVLVVTSDGFTLAGNGKQYTVKTSSSTMFSNGSNSVAVNDSVIVDGDTASGTITATRVLVQNQ